MRAAVPSPGVMSAEAEEEAIRDYALGVFSEGLADVEPESFEAFVASCAVEYRQGAPGALLWRVRERSGAGGPWREV